LKNLKRLLIFAATIGISHATYAAPIIHCVSTPEELRTAITTAASNGEHDEIKIVQGTYMGHFVYVGDKDEEFNLSIKGGYTTDCASQEINPENTILDANGTDNVLILVDEHHPINFVVDGLTIQNGNAAVYPTEGGGLYMKTVKGAVTLTNNIVRNNRAEVSGGGIYSVGASTVELIGNVIGDNKANGPRDTGGGGIYFATPGAITLTKNVLTGNTTEKNYTHGGGIYFADSSVATFDNNRISYNTAKSYGGGIYFGSLNTVTFKNNNLINENTAREGGGIYFKSSNEIDFTYNVIRYNTTVYANGGGIYFGSSSEITLKDNTIGNNTIDSNSRVYGAGIYFGISNTITITDNNISGNTANNSSNYSSAYGGGIYFDSHNAVTLTRNIINNNTVKTDGGGVYFAESSDTTDIYNNVISTNAAGGNGGGLYIQKRDATFLINNTISNNLANNGGGIWLLLDKDTDKADIYNNIIWNNNAITNGDDLYINNNGNGGFTPSILNLFNNDFDKSVAGSYFAIYMNIDPSNLDNIDPLFVDVEDGNYRLQIGSSCIDVGNNAQTIPPIRDIKTDKDGNPRIINDIVDMGAYEAFHCKLVTEIPKKECEALVVLYNSTEGAKWENNAEWKATHTPCSWHGVTCSGGHVLALQLENNNLTGSIPSELGNLSNLTQLDLGDNELTGKIPSELGNLSNLTLLELGDNSLIDSIPNELGKLSNLTQLDLGYNSLTSSIPSELGKLSNLTQLDLGYNKLIGLIPSELSNLTYLEKLWLRDNGLCGEIPAGLKNLSNIPVPDQDGAKLQLDNNHLTASNSNLIAWLDKHNPGWDTTQTPCPVTLQFSSTTYCVAEDGGQATITVTRNNNTNGAVSIEYATSNDTATAGNDYTQTSGTINWEDGDNAEKTFTVNITDDSEIENDETIIISLGNPTGDAEIGAPDTAVVTIKDNDPVTLQFSSTTYSVTEDGGQATITVTRNNNTNGAVSVEYATSDDTAIAGNDYTQTSGTIHWADGDNAEKTFTVDITDDSIIEDDETFIVSLSNPTGDAEIGSPDTAVVTIKDNAPTAFNCNSVTEIPKKECKALTALYDSTDGENWADNTGWKATNTPCSWKGVTCQEGHVTGLTLGNNNLNGAISKKFFKLNNLKSLDLSDNELSGTSLKKLNKFKNLEALLLNNCKLSGKLPNSMMKLTKLAELDLTDNCLETKVSKKLKKWLDELNPGWDDTQTNCLY
jgi:parallel beta-helix repeat protein/predicted outer membrane repeat protein